MPLFAAEAPDADPKRPDAGVAKVEPAGRRVFGRSSAAMPARHWVVAAVLVVALGCAARLWASLLPFATAVSLPSDPLWVRDFVQDYLLARVTLDRGDPYELISKLAREYLPAAVDRALPNPTPHPPTLISFVWPFGLVSYEVAALLWLGIQILALVVVSAILAGYLRGPWPLAGGRALDLREGATHDSDNGQMVAYTPAVPAVNGRGMDVRAVNGADSLGLPAAIGPYPCPEGQGLLRLEPSRQGPSRSGPSLCRQTAECPLSRSCGEPVREGAWPVGDVGSGSTPAARVRRWLGRWFELRLDGRDLAAAAGVALALQAWSPVAADLLQGQLMLVTAALLLLGWRAFRRGQPVTAGLLFGIAASVKLLPGVLLLFFVARRQYRVVVAAALVGVGALVTPLLWLGPGIVERYLFYALPTTGDFWLGCRGNYSVFGVVARFFGDSNEVLPVVDAPSLVLPVAAAISLALVAAAFWSAARGDVRGSGADDGEVEMAIFVVVMLLVFPIAWSHYLVLLAWPLTVVAARMRARGWARRDAILALVVAPHAILLPGDIIALGVWLFGSAFPADRLPFVATLPSLIPTIGLLALIWLLWRERAVGSAALEMATPR